MQQKAIETFCPASRQEWREWLKTNHCSRPSVWLILYKKETGKTTIAWSDAVDEALCFGWIDSIRRPVDGEKFMQFFSKRKLRGTWSKVNKEKVAKLIDGGLMMSAGLASVKTAKQNGSWTVLDDVEALKIPRDLEKAFKAQAGSKAYFTGLSRSARKSMLQWLCLAKRPETRQTRINEIAALASQKQKPKQFR